LAHSIRPRLDAGASPGADPTRGWSKPACLCDALDDEFSRRARRMPPLSGPPAPQFRFAASARPASLAMLNEQLSGGLSRIDDVPVSAACLVWARNPHYRHKSQLGSRWHGTTLRGFVLLPMAANALARPTPLPPSAAETTDVSPKFASVARLWALGVSQPINGAGPATASGTSLSEATWLRSHRLERDAAELQASKRRAAAASAWYRSPMRWLATGAASALLLMVGLKR
jgi:hypothetical protein